MKGGYETARGPIAWFAQNSVAANILMLVLLVGGFLHLGNIKQEVFPEFDLDAVVIRVPYPGASPDEVESGVLLAVEEAVRGVENVSEIRSTASEGLGVTAVELLLDADPDRALDDIKQAVDRITSFPEDVERHAVTRASTRNEVISVAVHGDTSEATLRELADRVREDLLAHDHITEVELSAVRPLEISIEVPQGELRRHGLTIPQIAEIVRASSVELPGGAVKTRGGEVLIRTSERRDVGRDFEDVIVVSRPDGTALRLGDIARINDGFAEIDQSATFDGKPAAMVRVYRTGDQKPIEIAEAVRDTVEEKASALPPAVDLAIWFDSSEFYQDRLHLLLKNAAMGLGLVILVLGAFLQLRLAFWVTVGILTAFVGAFLFLPATGVSINMISLFAFILVLGMVVDDAIVVGESVYRRRQEGMGPIEAAIRGAREVAAPVLFAIATTMIAYAPMLFVPGEAGQQFFVIPVVVIVVLSLSLAESLLILPSHLAHSAPAARSRPSLLSWVSGLQRAFSDRLDELIERRYVPAVRWAARRRYLTAAIAAACFVATIGVFAGGRIQTEFMPQVEWDVVVARAELPQGSPASETRALRDHLEASARAALEELGGDPDHVQGLFAQFGSTTFDAGANPTEGDPGGETHVAEVGTYLVGSDERPFSAEAFANSWRRRAEDFPGLDRLAMRYTVGFGLRAAIAIELRHRDREILEQAARELAASLEDFEGVHDIDDGTRRGKAQLDLRLEPAARTLGLTESDLAQQVRGAYFGAEALRQQRGREEVRTYVRLPAAERASEHDIENFFVRTPDGGKLPLAEAAQVERGRSFTSIQRIDGRRAIEVRADVDREITNANAVTSSLAEEVLPELMERHAGLSWGLAGQQRQQREVNASLAHRGTLALLAIFALLAVAFRSYVQPAVIMIVIPFGFVGAVWGHLIMNALGAWIPWLEGGYSFSLMSAFGVMALAGVVINDSLILMVAINRLRDQGASLASAVASAGARRFRPIVLTSVTTFAGLAPIILESSVQAQYVVPMAISLGFGVMFATLITLLLVPAIYCMTDDARRAISMIRGDDARRPAQ